MEFTRLATQDLDDLWEKTPRAAEVVERMLDELEEAPHLVRSQTFAPAGRLSYRGVPAEDLDVFVIWEWKRTSPSVVVVHRIGAKQRPAQRPT